MSECLCVLSAGVCGFDRGVEPPGADDDTQLWQTTQNTSQEFTRKEGGRGERLQQKAAGVIFLDSSVFLFYKVQDLIRPACLWVFVPSSVRCSGSLSCSSNSFQDEVQEFRPGV